jgi:16S rRNA (uracil1498-N3)-methyltransferase
MPATPAPPSKNAPPKSTPRLFVNKALSEGCEIGVDGPQAHYLLRVMRAVVGDPVKLFDDQTGVGKRDLTLKIEAKLRGRETGPDLWLCQALVKKDRLDWIAEKACELGVTRFVPVLTQRCVVDKVKEDRLRLQMIEAAEQCERTCLPEIVSLSKLEEFLGKWPQDRAMFFCDERGGENFGEAIDGNGGPAGILIGPEGGFTDKENDAIRACPAAVPVSLGPRILRADTAAVTAMAVWMANSKGSDWP